MREFSVIKDDRDHSRPYIIIDQDGLPITQRGRTALRRWKNEKAAERIAKLCNDAELNGCS